MNTHWNIPNTPPPLSAGEIHLWRVPLDLGNAEIAPLRALLSPDERQRAERFRRPRDARRFTAARGALRALLGATLGQEPSGLVFAYGPQGKPALLNSCGVPDLAFNVSHSEGLGLIALRRGGPIGVDIEAVRDDFDWEGIADRFYGDAEIAWLRALPPSEQHRGFFTLWTRKEAYIKACGESLWHVLSRLDVSRSPVREIGTADGPISWHFRDLDPGVRFKAAVAVQGPLPPLQTWQWVPER